MTEAMRKSWLPYLMVLAAGSVWGVTFSLARIATDGDAHPIGLNFWQTVIGLGVMLGICAFRGKWPARDRASVARYFVIACTGTVIPGTLYFYAASNLPVGILAITIAVVPMFTYLASLLIGSDIFSFKRVVGLLLGIIGLALLAHPEALPDRAMIPWLVAAVACAVCYTIENLFVDNKVPPESDMVCFLTGAFIFASILIVPVMLLTDTYYALALPLDKVDYSVIAMAFITAVAYLTFLTIIQIAGAVFASMMAYVVTLSGVGWGMLIFGESHSAIIWLVMALLMAGMMLVKPLDKAIA